MSSPSNDIPVADPPVLDSARQAADLAAFRRMMLASRGTFSLSFAVCDDRRLRDSLIERLWGEFPGILVVRLPPNVGDVYDVVRRQLPAQPPAAVLIVGLEASVPFEDDAQPALRALNSSREQWERFACPVVFWLAEYALTRLTIRAPDFWRYRSHQFEFISEATPLATATQEAFAGFDMVDALPFDEKVFRIIELERRLYEAGLQPPADLLPHVLTWSYELGRLYRNTNRFSEAEQCLRQALAWAESTFGPEHPKTANALNNLASLLQDTNRLAEAEPLMRRAVAITEAFYGQSHPHVSTVLNNLASLLQDTNRLAGTESLMRRALAIDEVAYDATHPSVAIRLNNLAQLLQSTNRLAEAEPLMRRSLAASEATYGQHHPDVAVRLNNLAILLKDTNRLREAEPLMRRGLAIEEATNGKDHPNVAIQLSNLGQLLKATNRVGEAEPLMRRALAITEAAYGQEHPDVARNLSNLAILLIHTNRLADAETPLRRAVEILLKSTRATGHPHAQLNRTINNYRELLIKLGDSAAQAQEKIDNLVRPLSSH